MKKELFMIFFLSLLLLCTGCTTKTNFIYHNLDVPYVYTNHTINLVNDQPSSELVPYWAMFVINYHEEVDRVIEKLRDGFDEMGIIECPNGEKTLYISIIHASQDHDMFKGHVLISFRVETGDGYSKVYKARTLVHPFSNPFGEKKAIEYILVEVFNDEAIIAYLTEKEVISDRKN